MSDLVLDIDDHDRNATSKARKEVLRPVGLSGASKVNDGRRGRGSRYGSTGTISTEAFTSLSSSPSSSSHESTNSLHHMSLDLGSSVDNNDSSSEDDTLLGESSQASYSDISSDGGQGQGGYYDRFARHKFRSRDDACSFIENSVLTRVNFKVSVALVSWFITYMIMGVFGGSVAFMHFERRNASMPDPLPDYGYDVIPVSTCERESSSHWGALSA